MKAAHDLLTAVLRTAGARPARVSLVGICKNAGKTTAVNALIGAAEAAGVALALVSAGRDGEETDAITDLPKPRIRVPAGAWVATARDALPRSTAVVAVQRELPYCQTPLGPVVLGRVTAPGDVLLIGPGSARRLHDAMAALGEQSAAAGRPAGLYLVDGSFDRIAAAAPGVTGTVVLAVGAAYSESMKATVAQAAHLLDLFASPPVDAGRLPAVTAAMAAAPVCWVWPSGQVEPLPLASVLTGADQAVAAAAERLGRPDGGRPAAETGAMPGRPLLVCAGAVTDRLVGALVLRPAVAGRIGLAVRDATRLLADRQLWRRFRRQGGLAMTVDPVRVAAVTCNPWSPTGAGYPPPAFARAVAAVAGRRPVLDLEAGLMEVMAGADDAEAGAERDAD